MKKTPYNRHQQQGAGFECSISLYVAAAAAAAAAMHRVDGFPDEYLQRANTISQKGAFTIQPARSERDIQATITLIKAYTASLGVDLAFQGFQDEMASFPGKYSPPDGEILLAIDDASEEVLGCICLRPLVPKDFSSDKIVTSIPAKNSVNDGKRYCEMKRLYVLPSTRGRGVGKALVLALLQVARDRGYDEMRLDTLRHMHAPIELYRSMGFKDIDKYYETPLDNTVFLGLEL
ncbi:Acetyltransferase CD1211 [Trichophyton interdigitale]|uniref:Acetyltransferase domain containing protein n=1 Tax=Trichophyton interdigitale TaxID=101480 RepID=A0A9P4YJ76_9EURO|nr:Acetyltransferase CD1211 [Trichophyton interdigitale]KAF3895225.1 Acetyltransferase domain containing protein [Trichophyton interdigitale]KAG8208705.1 Acetyltransferase CD1211 [Trichophyton interdigitale]